MPDATLIFRPARVGDGAFTDGRAIGAHCDLLLGLSQSVAGDGRGGMSPDARRADFADFAGVPARRRGWVDRSGTPEGGQAGARPLSTQGGKYVEGRNDLRSTVEASSKILMVEA